MQGASINIADSKQTIPLLYAVANNHIESAQALIRRNSKINITDDLDRNCYHLAITGSDGDINLLEFLLSVNVLILNDSNQSNQADYL